MKTYSEFITEAKIPSKIAEKYGKILFGELDFSKLGFEPDTPLEKDQLNDIREFLHGRHGSKLDADMIKVFKSLAKLKKTYPEFLEPDNYKELFRGILLNRFAGKVNSPIRLLYQKVRDIMINTPIEKFKNYDNHWYVIPDKMTYTPMSPVQSWSTKFRVASGFGGGGASSRTSEEIKSVIIANPPRKEMLFNTKFTNGVDDYLEYEVIRLTDKPIKCQILVRHNEIQQVKEDHERISKQRAKHDAQKAAARPWHEIVLK